MNAASRHGEQSSSVVPYAPGEPAGGGDAGEDDWPFVGRDGDLELIDARLAAGVRSGRRGGGVLLVGAAGVGKTRLLRASVEHARRAGWRVAYVMGSRSSQSVPLGAVSHLVLPAVPPGRASRLGPWLYHRAAAKLAGSGSPPLLLAIDDAHLLDDASAALVHQLVVQGRAGVVATALLGEPNPDVLVALWKDEFVERRDVLPLPGPALDALIDHALPGTVSGPVRHRLRRFAAGNPLYLRELLRSAVQSRALHLDGDGLWRWRAPLRPGARLGELVQRQFDAAGPAATDVVDLVACCGEPPLSLLDGEVGLLAAERAGLIEVSADSERSVVRLSSALYGEVLAERRGPIRTREMHRRLARRLAAMPVSAPRRGDLVRLAAWRLGAGLPVEPDVLLAAARDAAARRDLDLTQRLARPLVDGGSPEALLLLADALQRTGRAAEAAALLASVPPVTLSTGHRARWLEILLRTGTNCGPHALTLLGDGRPGEAARAAAAVLADPHAVTEERLAGHLAATGAAVALGRATDAVRAADAGLRLAADYPHAAAPTADQLRLGLGHALLVAGRLNQARRLAERGYWGAVEVGDNWSLFWWLDLRGQLALLTGDLPAAQRAMLEGAGVAADFRPAVGTRLPLSGLAAVRGMAGDRIGAAGWLARAAAVRDTVPALHRPRLGLLRAWALRATEGPGAAAREALAAAAVARGSGQLLAEAQALHAAVQLGAPATGDIAARLGELAGAADSPLVSAFAGVAQAVHRGDPRALEAAADRLDQFGAVLLAAETRAAAARAHRAAGKPGRASRLTPREREVAELAARRLTSRQIAAQLRVSVRTVDNHLARAYGKLGVANRAGLASVLGTRAATR